MAQYINKDTYVGDTGKQLKDIKTNQEIVDLIYPIGSIFLTINKVNPGTFLGGTWEQYYGGYLYLAQNSVDKTNYSGWGTQGHQLTVQQMPEHYHDGVKQYYGGTEISNRGDGGGGGRNILIFNTSSSQNGSYAHLQTLNTGGNQSHSHNIATCDVFCYKRTA